MSKRETPTTAPVVTGALLAALERVETLEREVAALRDAVRRLERETTDLRRHPSIMRVGGR